MDDITRVCNGCRELAVSKIHQMVEVDRQMLVIFDKHASVKCKFGNRNAVPRAVACSPSV